MNQRVVITGGTAGIGLAITKAFARAGARVLVGARTAVTELPEGVVFEATDVRERAQVHALAERCVELYGGVDVWVNNAGVSIWRAIDGVDEAFFQQLIQTNIGGTIWGSQAAAAAMVAGGCIVNIASLAGRRGSANNSVYCASKFGVVGVTQALAKELGPRGIRVNSVCPVYVRTAALVSNLRGDHPADPEADPHGFLDAFAASSTALGRLPTEDDVARTCLFLSSDAAGAITGQNINVDCGTMPQ